MADRPTTSETSGARPKREGPTIDLTATDVSPAEPAGAKPQGAEPRTESQSTKKRTAWFAGHRARFGNYLNATTLAGGVAGGLIAAAAMAVFWIAGTGPSADGSRAQIALLQRQVQDLQIRVAAVADNKALDTFNARIGKLEEALAKLPPADASLGERVSAADNAMKALGMALAALSHRTDDAAAAAKEARERVDAADRALKELQANAQNASKEAAPAELGALQQRIAVLEQAAQAAHEQIAKTGATDKAARFAVNAAMLRAAVESGTSYAAELAQAKSLGADEKDVGPLEPFAASGLPDKQAVARELSTAMPAIIKASDAGAVTGSFLERLEANAGKLVRVRPVGAPAGDDTAAVLARLEVAAAQADIDGALADIAKLPEPARASARGFIAKVEARQAALVASRALAANAARALGAP